MSKNCRTTHLSFLQRLEESEGLGSRLEFISITLDDILRWFCQQKRCLRTYITGSKHKLLQFIKRAFTQGTSTLSCQVMLQVKFNDVKVRSHDATVIMFILKKTETPVIIIAVHRVEIKDYY